MFRLRLRQLPASKKKLSLSDVRKISDNVIGKEQFDFKKREGKLIITLIRYLSKKIYIFKEFVE